MVSDKTVEHALKLIGECYEAALNPDLWTSNLENVVKLVSGVSATLVYEDFSNDDAGISVNWNLSEEFLENYNNYYHAIDRCTKAICKMPGQVRHIQEVMNCDDSLYSAEFEEDFVKPYDIQERIGFALPLGGERHCVLAVQSSKDKPLEQQQKQLLAWLAPHIARSFKIHSAFSCATSIQQALTRGIENLNFGVLLLDPSGKVMWLNELAESLLKKYPGLSIRNQFVYANSPDHNKRLHEMIHTSVQTALGQAICAGQGGA